MKHQRPIAFALCLALFWSSVAAAGQTPLPPYKDPSLPVEKRVEDLVARMTLEEKVSQMVNAAAPIERLGIPAYDWWNEALHGVARAGYATVFPQAIGLAATWNDDLIHRVADVIATEARAKHHEFVRRGERGRYQGLTFWSPNINIFRDPRWGRGQETYGEDPYLTGRLAVAFIRGLQGDDPRYFKVVATAKHYAVHSGPEPERHSFNAMASERDLRETYLPAFRASVVEGKVAGVMCAYNRTNGEPCCANRRLLTDILRGEWGFTGHVVSDCGAIEDIYRRHRFARSEAEAAALAVKAGTDLSCGNEYKSLVQAVREGLISEQEIDAALKRLLTIRFRLGMFDPPEMVPYARIPFSENDSPAHRQLALEAARQSIVLLKNEAGALPLRKDLRTIAVIGPNADAPEVLLGNYNGQPSKSVTPLAGIRAKVSPRTRVIYELGSTLTGEPVAPVPASALPGGLKAEYFNNKDLQGQPALVRTDEQVNFNWDRGRPAPQVNDDGFSVRWTGRFVPPESGPYRIGAIADDGVRVYLDGKLLIDEWTPSPNNQPRTLLKDVQLEAGRAYDVRIEYFDQTRAAVARFVWSFPRFKERLIEDAVRAARQADAVILVLGISPTLEGEEMQVNVEGFRGGDRTDIALPRAQEDLLRAVQAVGKPTIVVLLSGSALAVNWASEHSQAILEAWYPGEEGGTAIADVLFGDYNPAGRLPVTFYKSVGQLPPFEDYRMEGRTYRYFRGEPLYPFGFGLSYARFRYSNLRLSAEKIRAGESLTVSVDVENVGQRAGDEVVQLYITDLEATVPVPIRSLAGFKRISLAPGERRTVQFTLAPRQMSLIDDRGRRIIEPGAFLISVGGKQPGFTGRADAATTGVVTGRFTVFGEKLELPEK
ncbi:glycoside hydrolase family 3 C-terminal domain-containing protein [Pyrinomonas methylaliphatogenes]|uniref:Beta-glucosidase-like glycosyl hydrolase n=1 Tax=Pyrinomonas methylaliphatogenes TaxID=454194 RepID=A0A0B6WV21_9BACT|nr:glycoside hydrolase family 3 C-terminal domain-containing protein [Pyrinomonas methylaliphatogenes]CDM65133.1 beta-glucosidase-like glycosyl hydrolase [Pyrinomonas methylaliphatogenes]